MKYSWFAVSLMILNGCAVTQMKTGPDVNLRLYHASQNIGEQITALPSLKKQDKILLLNVTYPYGSESKTVLSDIFAEDKTREIDGQEQLAPLTLDAIDDGLLSGMINKGASVVGLKAESITAKERNQYNKIIAYRIFTHHFAGSTWRTTEQGLLNRDRSTSNTGALQYSATKLRLLIRVIDADTGLATQTVLLETSD